jgi:uncharacterized protein (TIRG00374 family)
MRNQNFGEMKLKLQHANWNWAILALLFGFLSNIFRSLRWNMLILPLGYKPKLVNTFGAVMIGYMANLAIPKLGEVTKCAVLNQYEKAPINKLFGTVVVERIIDVLTIFLLLGVVVIFEFDKMSSFSIEYIFKPMGIKFQNFISQGTTYYIIVGISLVAIILLLWFITTKFKGTRSFIKLKFLIRGFVAGINTIGRMENRNLFIVYTALIWFLYMLMSYSCFFCFQATSDLGFVAALTIMVFGGFGWAAPIQGGVGSFHFFVTQSLILFGITEDNALAYAILSHATQVFAMLGLGLIMLLILPIVNRKKKVVA